MLMPGHSIGSFACLTLGLDMTSPEAMDTYRLRDEQEKYNQQMKSEMASDRQRNWFRTERLEGSCSFHFTDPKLISETCVEVNHSEEDVPVFTGCA